MEARLNGVSGRLEHELELDPHDAGRALGLLEKNQIRLTPAVPPRLWRGASARGA